MLLFADYKNLAAVRIQAVEVGPELWNISRWLAPNKLVSVLDKTLLLVVNTAASASENFFNRGKIKKQPVFKNLGILVDYKLSFVSHIEEVKNKLSQSGGIAELRPFVPRKLVIAYYELNIRPIIQYGVLIYGSSSSSLLFLRKRKSKFIYFREQMDSCENIFVKPRYRIFMICTLSVNEICFESNQLPSL